MSCQWTAIACRGRLAAHGFDGIREETAQVIGKFLRSDPPGSRCQAKPRVMAVAFCGIDMGYDGHGTMNSDKVPPLSSRARRIWAPFVLAALLLSACVDSPPKIGLDTPSTPAFDKRVKEQFPVGSAENLMLSELRKEGFGIPLKYPLTRGYASSANFSQRQGVCDVTWAIEWNVESGKITAIEGSRGMVCL